MKTVLIDCGKSFYTSALEWFPRLGLRQIDAVLLTHAHADAMNGLDDLRGWTLGGFVQAHIDIYCDPHTMQEVARSFPYLVKAEFATGGGDLPEFRWHTFDEHDPEGFSLLGVRVTPLPVHHGRYFVSTGDTDIVKPYLSMGFLFDSLLPEKGGPSATANGRAAKAADVIRTHELAYISDCSEIPEATYARIGQVKTLVIDCLRPIPHTSHFGVLEAIEAAHKILTPHSGRSYWVGFAHRITHADWVTAGLALRETRQEESSHLEQSIKDAGLATAVAKARQLLDSNGDSRGTVWAMPAYDGLSLRFTASSDRLEDLDMEYE